MTKLSIPVVKINYQGLSEYQQEAMANYQMELRYAALNAKAAQKRKATIYDQHTYYDNAMYYLSVAGNHLAAVKQRIPSWEGRIVHEGTIEMEKPE